MEIIEKKEHLLLSRTEIIAKDSYTGATPSRGSVKERLANTLKANKDLLLIKHIYPKFGFGTAKIIAYLYSDKKNMEKIEPEYAFKKGVSKKKEEEKKADKAKAEKKKEEVKPVEQKKPEQKEEIKSEQKQEGKKEQSPDKPLKEKKS